jgi:hypothetical protein
MWFRGLLHGGFGWVIVLSPLVARDASFRGAKGDNASG